MSRALLPVALLPVALVPVAGALRSGRWLSLVIFGTASAWGSAPRAAPASSSTSDLFAFGCKDSS
jgi:hypothetical protein